MTDATTTPTDKAGEPVIGTNSGHGHAWKRPDGVRMRCGGPRMCKQCAIDAARVADRLPHPQPSLSVGLDRQSAIAAMSIELEKHPAFPDAVKALVWSSRLYDAALAAPAEGYVLVPVEAVQPFIDVLMDIGESEADEDTFRNANRYTAKAPAITVGHIRRLAACLPAAPTGGRK